MRITKNNIAERLNWLYENDKERFELISFVIEALSTDESINISKDLYTNELTITVPDKEYMHKYKCSSSEEANKIVDIIMSMAKKEVA